jgi:stage V sporulation protein D (sporulation-specific penicillin-binding protein)
MHKELHHHRMLAIFGAIGILTILIVGRLFVLQVIKHNYYFEIAQAEQQGYTTLPSRRGEILINDHHSGEVYKLATNTTLNMIYADPTLIAKTSDPELVATTLAPYLFDIELERELDELSYKESYEIALAIENEELREEAFDKLDIKDEEELFIHFEEKLIATLAQQDREVILIAEELDVETQTEILEEDMTGLELTENGNLYAYPKEITDKEKVAKELAKIFDTDQDSLERILLGKNRYVVLKRKLDPLISEEIETILTEDRFLDEPFFLGIQLEPEYFRFYPEQELSAQILGYVNSAGDGQYGIEGSFDSILKGIDGIFTSQIDAYGNQITVGKSIIEQAQDGADITLTIDRAVQLQVENYLAEGVEEFNADSGQAIVLNPKTGAIIAMANYPSFNPNTYGDVFEIEELSFTEQEEERIFNMGTEEEPRYYYYAQTDPDVRYEIFPDEEDPDTYYGYTNSVGPEVYKNKMIQEVYEPGSVFKPITMISALDAGELTPSTTFIDSGPLDVDYNVLSGVYDGSINNFDGQHHGIQTMTQVLEKSNNIGMAWVAEQLGPALFYSYIDDFGLTKRTDIEFLDEVTGKVEYYDGWTQSELYTKAFGQGLSMTPLQLVQAYTALSNEGTMMQPYIVERIEHPDGSVETFEPETLRQVVDEKASSDVTHMLTATMESYLSLKLEDHYVAGKSGTAQTYKWGRALSGPGTTIASFIGYGPIDEPEFLVLVKLDRPRTIEWGSSTSGPIWKKITTFLYDYYNVPPDKT